MRDRSFESTALGPEVLAWLDWLEMGGAAATTLEQYERDLARLALAFLEHGIADLTDVEISRVVNSYPKPSRRVRKAAIASLFAWAKRTRRIEQNPCEYLPQIRRSPQKAIDIFTEAEVEALLDLPLVDSVLMRLLIDGGLRKSEASALRVRHLKLDPPEVTIIGGKGGKDRVIPMTAGLTAAVEEFLLLERPEPNDHLWYVRPGGGPNIRRHEQIGKTSFATWWRRCLADAGVRYRSPHVARHTFATRWLRRGGRLETLAQVMGHSSIRTTADLYSHLDTRDVLADMAIIEGLALAG